MVGGQIPCQASTNALIPDAACPNCTSMIFIGIFFQCRFVLYLLIAAHSAHGWSHWFLLKDKRLVRGARLLSFQTQKWPRLLRVQRGARCRPARTWIPSMQPDAPVQLFRHVPSCSVTSSLGRAGTYPEASESLDAHGTSGVQSFAG